MGQDAISKLPLHPLKSALNGPIWKVSTLQNRWNFQNFESPQKYTIWLWLDSLKLPCKFYTPLSVSRWHDSWWRPRTHWSVFLEREKSIKKFAIDFWFLGDWNLGDVSHAYFSLQIQPFQVAQQNFPPKLFSARIKSPNFKSPRIQSFERFWAVLVFFGDACLH